MNVRSLARLLVVLACACFGLFLGAGFASAQDGTAVQNSNDSTGTAAVSAPVVGGNVSTSQTGPAATGGGRAAMVGDTNTTVDQDAHAKGAPVSAGSQSTDASGGAKVQNSNRTNGAAAVGTPVVAVNASSTHNGPRASGPDANAAMIGDGAVSVDQDALAEGGPADAGSQRTSAHGPAVVQNVNDCGNAVTNCGVALAGPVGSVNVLGIPFLAPSGAGPVAVSGGDAATATLVGDADAVFTQSAEGRSGAAGVGFQDTDATGGVVQNGNQTTNAAAASGPVASTNFGFANVGPVAFGFAGDASAAQVGNVSGNLDMSSSGQSGDAFSGSQTTGAVGALAGLLTVQNRSASEDDVAVSGFAVAGSTVGALAGPAAVGIAGSADARQFGDAGFDIRTESDAVSGNADAGTQDTEASGGISQADNTSLGAFVLSGGAWGRNTVASAAGPMAISAGAPTSAVQFGDAFASDDLRAGAQSGDAAAGFQDISVGAGAIAAPSNTQVLGAAVSGLAMSGNVVGTHAGPFALGAIEPTRAALAGDADTAVRGDAQTSTGDALTGGQLIDASGGATLDSNTALGTFAVSGNALAHDVVGLQAGPVGLLGGDAVQFGDASAGLDAGAAASSGDAVTGVQASRVSGGASANDNFAALSAAISPTACASPLCLGTIVIDAGDPADPTDDVTGLAPGGNIAALVAGPVAAGPGADAALAGDASIGHRMIAAAFGGDAIASSQFGEVGFGAAQNSNSSVGALAGCGVNPGPCTVTAGNIAAGQVGGLALPFGTAVMAGDAGAGGSQVATGVGGDSVAGSQLLGSGFGAAQNDNDATGATAGAGPATSFNAVPFLVGPVALAGSAGMAGGAFLSIDQDTFSASGDAIAGSQVGGVSTGLFGLFGGPTSPFGGGLGSQLAALLGSIPGLPGTGLSGIPGVPTTGLGGLGGLPTTGLSGLIGGASQQQNESTNDTARSGAATAFDVGAVLVGPFNAVQAGRGVQRFGQDATAISGPAFAGSQVSGGGVPSGLFGSFNDGSDATFEDDPFAGGPLAGGFDGTTPGFGTVDVPGLSDLESLLGPFGPFILRFVPDQVERLLSESIGAGTSGVTT